MFYLTNYLVYLFTLFTVKKKLNCCYISVCLTSNENRSVRDSKEKKRKWLKELFPLLLLLQSKSLEVILEWGRLGLGPRWWWRRCRCCCSWWCSWWRRYSLLSHKPNHFKVRTFNNLYFRSMVLNLTGINLASECAIYKDIYQTILSHCSIDL